MESKGSRTAEVDHALAGYKPPFCFKLSDTVSDLGAVHAKPGQLRLLIYIDGTRARSAWLTRTMEVAIKGTRAKNALWLRPCSRAERRVVRVARPRKTFASSYPSRGRGFGIHGRCQ